MPVTRFAPSPTGYLHLGSAYSALFAAEAARGGKFLLRIEDIDPVRCKPEFADAVFEDLGWLGLSWEQPVRKQSEHLDDYAGALEKLRAMGVLYPCFCTRREISLEAAAAAHAPHAGLDGPVYPGTCRNLSKQEQEDRIRKLENVLTGEGSISPPPLGGGLGGGSKQENPPPAKTKGLPKGQTQVFASSPQGVRSSLVNWRLNIAKALEITGSLTWHDRAHGAIEAKPRDFGDVVLARKDVPTSYHLSVTVDDHLQGITLVTRGEDLLRSTDIHRLLQALLGYQTPEYHHHPLVTDAAGKRFAKRNQAVTLRALRAAGKSTEDVKEMLLKF